LKINEVEQLVGITKKNIRFYEQEGLLNPGRSDNGYRDYSDADVAVLRQIKLLRKLAVPLEEIRKMQSGQLTAADGLQRHMITLQREQENLQHAASLCRRMVEQNVPLSQLDTRAWLQEMERMEQEGVRFVNIYNRDIVRKYLPPIGIAVAVVALLSAFLYMALPQLLADGAPGFVVVLVCAVAVLMMIGVTAALVQRIREIRGGEEDAAGKY